MNQAVVTRGDVAALPGISILVGIILAATLNSSSMSSVTTTIPVVSATAAVSSVVPVPHFCNSRCCLHCVILNGWHTIEHRLHH